MLECIESREEKQLTLGSVNQLVYGKFLFSKLEKGQGLTLANTLRRILLYEMPTVGITSVYINQTEKIDLGPLDPRLNVEAINDGRDQSSERFAHEFSTLVGVKESVLEILQNLKSILFSLDFPYEEPQKAFLSFGPSQLSDSENRIIQAKHLKLPPNVKLLNPEQYIAHQIVFVGENNFSYNFELTIEKITQVDVNGFGDSILKGFSTRAGTNRSTKNRRVLPIDASFFPVKKVNYTIEADSFGKELVFLEIWTNGSLLPQEAIEQSLEKAVQLFQKFQF
jgi:DNA-directed RNA polymerase subunit alpha